MEAVDAITVERLAAAKGLSSTWLRAQFGLTDSVTEWGERVVRIPYRDLDGRRLCDKLRRANGRAWRDPKGGSFPLYGLDALAVAAADDPCLIVEGETDRWACAAHGVLAIGVSGACGWGTAWQPEYARLVCGRRIVVWEEPGVGGPQFVRAIAPDLPDALVIASDATTKDPCALHQREGDGFAAALEDRIDRAVPIIARTAALIAASPAPRPRVTVYRPAPAGTEALDYLLARARERSTIDLLKKRGLLDGPDRRLRGDGVYGRTRCPFPDHADGSPSFSVSRVTGAWKCHGCGRKGGDAIALVRQLDGLSFRDAVARAAG